VVPTVSMVKSSEKVTRSYLFCVCFSFSLLFVIDHCCSCHPTVAILSLHASAIVFHHLLSSNPYFRSTVNKMCEVPGCFVRPSFKFPVRGSASQRCARHKLPGMIGNSCKSPASTANAEPKSVHDEGKVTTHGTPKRMRGEMLRIQREEMMQILAECGDCKGSETNTKPDVPPSMIDSVALTSCKRMKHVLTRPNADNGGTSSLSLSSSSNLSVKSDTQPTDVQQMLSYATQQQGAPTSKAACSAAAEHVPKPSLQAAINSANCAIPYAAQNTNVDFNRALLEFNAYNAALWNANSVVSMTNPYAMQTLNCNFPFAALSAMPPNLGSGLYNPSLFHTPSLASSLQNMFTRFPLNLTSAFSCHSAPLSTQLALTGCNSMSMPTSNIFQNNGTS
jgi:hypothetical protein